MLVTVLLFILGLVFLIFGGDWFVDGAVGIAERLRLPEVLIGATVVSIGTTLPEVMVSAESAVMGHGEIAYGNAIGSVICNTALILALTIAIRPAKAERKDILLSSVFFLIAVVIYIVSAYIFQTFSRVTGIMLLVVFAVYMVISVRKSLLIFRAQRGGTPSVIENEAPAEEDKPKGLIGRFKKTVAGMIVMLIIGAALISIGADLLIDNGIVIANALHVPESVIALTFVALGTSLPELVTAITSLVKGHGSLSLGNIVGANLFNLVLVSGLSITISPFSVPAEKTIAGINSSLLVDIPLMVVVMAIAIIPVLIKNKLNRVQGIILLVLYALFCVYQFAF